MRLIESLKIIVFSYRAIVRRCQFPRFNQPHVVLLCMLLLLTVIITKSLADPPSYAEIVNVEGNGSDFWIKQSSIANGIAVAKGMKMESGGSLSVPTKNHSASFSFVTSDQKYAGLTVKTRDKGTYTFPCEVRGYYILAWSGDGGGPCSAGKGGIDIILSSGETLSHLTKFVERTASTVEFRGKQNSDKQRSDRQGSNKLAINPGQGQVLIRTSIVGTASVVDYIESCTPGKTELGPPSTTSGPPRIEPGSSTAPQCKRIPKPTISDIVNIEVLDGDIIARSKEKPDGELVKKGQKYSYPERSFGSINSSAEANSCEMLRFLNAAYWSSPKTPKSVSDSIAEQLKQHRKVLGVSGNNVPDELSKLEKEIVGVMNRERTNHNLPPFSISKGMSKANRDHVNDQVGSGKYLGHGGNKSVGTGDRLSRYGSVGCASYDEDEFENIIYLKQSSVQASATGQSVVKEMKTTYKPRRTGKQDNLLNPDFQVVGVACDSKMSEMCVITYAEGYLEKN